MPSQEILHKNQIRKYVLIFAFLIFLAPRVWADTITLKSGRTLQGTVLDQNEEKVTFSYQGVDFTFYRDEIEKIVQSPAVKTNSSSENSQTVERGKIPSAPIPETSPIKVKYKIIKRLNFTALTHLVTFQFKYPLMRINISGQTISDIVISPKPGAVVSDPNGNEIAVFYASDVPSGGKINIVISYIVEIEDTDKTIDPARIVPLTDHQKVQLAPFLESAGDIRIDDSAIKGLADSIVGEMDNSYLKAKAIYDYIRNNIGYENLENDSGLRKPLEVLTRKKGNCADISLLFVALARSVDIPVRLVDGVAVQFKDATPKVVMDAGHAWTEIYLSPYGWLAVDPTFAINAGEKYFCFRYAEHIREMYGQLNSKDIGSLYEGSSLEVRTSELMNQTPVKRTASIEAERITP